MFPLYGRRAGSWSRLLVVSSVLLTSSLCAEEPNLDFLTRLRQEGLRHSKVMETFGELTDRIGPRLTGSPAMRQANEWTRDQFAAWGLANARLEPWGPFGDGWTVESAAVRMTVPDVAQLYAIPRPWTPGTGGPVRGPVAWAVIKTKEDIEKFRGKLTGKIVLFGDLPENRAGPKNAQLTDQDLDDLFHYQIPSDRDDARGEARKRLELAAALREFWVQEKPLAVILPSRGTDGTIFVQASGQAYLADKHDPVTTLSMSVEHYSRLKRLVDRKQAVELELTVATTFHPDGLTQHNTLAEIPGTDPELKDEVVMLGAHLDSWVGATGATDNAAGSAVVLEAMRILKAAGIQPRRTIRAALWSGEEQGLLGSRAYVEQHFATRADPSDTEELKLPKFLWRDEHRAVTLKPEQAKISAYYNLDNGAGKVRGIYAQENLAAAAIFENWIVPLKDLGVTTVTRRNTGSTDHIPFDSAGIPGFQFIQDDLDYMTRTHHSNMDTPEHVKREDLMQASVVMAWFVYNSAMRDDLLPRKPLVQPAPAGTK
ncbi:Leupeptin-inactivating enzyme 1 precursor [Lacunisphaera limnophila]|uniref:Carboxypeptidase Q n=1 Tax=Lacunisphaera limnophila TaxID=1838286 RepID=A0A1I7PHU3_9BACT|nr:M20/M25/M40 family metallo-hydrolase [Lacunisphaera limnophila]AOS43188.1 Leupeptin-inactivating enzyme 1 precursor [Lacunisphaera limnophila]